MKFDRRLVILSALVLLMLLECPAFPKVKTDGAVFGTVIAPTGSKTGLEYAPVRNADVIIIGEGKTRTVKTGKAGGFQVQGVKPGEYVITVTKSDYRPFTMRFSLKKAEMKRFRRIKLLPGKDFKDALKSRRSDTVFVTFRPVENPGSAPSLTRQDYLNRIRHQDPSLLLLEFDRGKNPYDPGSQVNPHPMSIMTIEPGEEGGIDYINLAFTPDRLLFDDTGNLLFIGADDGSIAVYSTRTNKMAGVIRIKKGVLLLGMDFCKKRKRLLAGFCGNGSGVAVVNPFRMNVERIISISNMADGSAAAVMGVKAGPEGKKAYVALKSKNSGEVACINMETGQVISRAPCGAYPVCIEAAPDFSRLYVANMNSASVSILSAEPLKLITNAGVSASPISIAVCRDGRFIYTACREVDVIIKMSPDGVQKGEISVGKQPVAVALSVDGTKLYVACKGVKSLWIIDPASGVILKKTLAQPNSEPFWIVVKP